MKSLNKILGTLLLGSFCFTNISLFGMEDPDFEAALQASLASAAEDQIAKQVLISSAFDQYSEFLTQEHRDAIEAEIANLDAEVQEAILEVLNTQKNLDTLDMLDPKTADVLRSAISASSSEPSSPRAASASRASSDDSAAGPADIGQRDESGALKQYQMDRLKTLAERDTWNANQGFASAHEPFITQVTGLYQGWNPTQAECPLHTHDMCGFYAFFFACYFNQNQDQVVKQRIPHIESLNDRGAFNALITQVRRIRRNDSLQEDELPISKVEASHLKLIYPQHILKKREGTAPGYMVIPSMQTMENDLVENSTISGFLDLAKNLPTQLREIGNQLKDNSLQNFVIILHCKVHPSNPLSEYNHYITINVTYNSEIAALQFTIVDSLGINHTNDPDVINLYNLLNGTPTGIWEAFS